MKTCWFGWFKGLFVADKETETDKKTKRWRWVPYIRIKFKRHHALPSQESKEIDEATEKRRKYAVTVAIATAAAAEAAVAAAKAAVEVVRLTGSQQSHFTLMDKHLAATKIQSVFRAHLAKKALRALKGLVKLQAIIRGQAVRRQVATKMKHLPSNTKTWLQGKCCTAIDQIRISGEFKSKELEDIDSKLECQSRKCWDYSTLLKEDMETLWMKRQEASIKRDRMMKYSFSHRERRNSQMLEESLFNKLELLAQKGAYIREGMGNLKPIAVSSLSTSDMFGSLQVKARNAQKQNSLEALNSPVSFPRRSFCRTTRSSAGNESSIPNSPVFPTFMAATESAKAKARSMSTPRQRISTPNALLDHSISYKNGLSLWSSYDGEVFSSCRKGGMCQNFPANINHHY